MAASINDKISSVSNGLRPASTTVQAVRNSGGTNLSCGDLSGWATVSAEHFITYKVDGQGEVIPGSQADWKGILTGNEINNLVLTGGTDNGNEPGDKVEAVPTAAWAKDLADAIKYGHNQLDGSHKPFTESSIVTTESLQTGAVTKTKIGLSSFGTVDANGWADFGLFYFKRYSHTNTTSIAANASIYVNTETSAGSGPVAETGAFPVERTLAIVSANTTTANLGVTVTMDNTFSRGFFAFNGGSAAAAWATRTVTMLILKV